MTWKFERALPQGGHRLWRHVESGRIAITDHSGDGWYGEIRNPEYAEHEILWLDLTRRIKLDRDRCFVPIINDKGEPSHTFEWAGGGLLLAALYGMKLTGAAKFPITFTVSVDAAEVSIG